MSKTARQKQERGQALVELLVAGPILISFFGALAFTLYLGWIQLEVSSLAQEFGVCLQSKKHKSRCRDGFTTSLEKLPGRFRVERFSMGSQQIDIELHHKLPFLKPKWSFHEPLPQYPE